ncbi:MAG TPA: hypothetical protein VJ349_08665, partial [Stellaceae bacterium]|nr:hypothetical protein [Stellaceae bacterium]
QIVAAANAIRALLPPGIERPIVVQCNASSVPVLQINPQLGHPQRAAALRFACPDGLGIVTQRALRILKEGHTRLFFGHLR